MDTIYRRHRPWSRLEQLLAQIVHCEQRPRELDFRVNLVSDVDTKIVAEEG